MSIFLKNRCRYFKRFLDYKKINNISLHFHYSSLKQPKSQTSVKSFQLKSTLSNRFGIPETLPKDWLDKLLIHTLRLTLENTNFWLLEYMTVGRSEQANTFVVERDLNVLSMVGWVPSVTFFLSVRDPRVNIKNKHDRWTVERNFFF